MTPPSVSETTSRRVEMLTLLIETLRREQGTPLRCNENQMAIDCLQGARGWLTSRQSRRDAEGKTGDEPETPMGGVGNGAE